MLNKPVGGSIYENIRANLKKILTNGFSMFTDLLGVVIDRKKVYQNRFGRKPRNSENKMADFEHTICLIYASKQHKLVI